ncbi:MAG: hypothetical protein M1482_00300, partial [Chloroflexi bacterium]|nr:hypothetical protein [Chloroflexota bacterium]
TDSGRSILAVLESGYPAGAVMFGMTLLSVRRGAFRPRAVLEVRVERDPDPVAFFNVTMNGEPLQAQVQVTDGEGESSLRGAAGELGAFTQLRSAAFRLPLRQALELKVWAHQITPQGNSQGLNARVQVGVDGTSKEFGLEPGRSQVVLPVGDGPCLVELSFS